MCIYIYIYIYTHLCTHLYVYTHSDCIICIHMLSRTYEHLMIITTITVIIVIIIIMIPQTANSERDGGAAISGHYKPDRTRRL